MRATVDIGFTSHGTVVTIQAESETGQEWLTEHVEAEPWQETGLGIACEPRLALAIAEGARQAGLVVQ